MGGGIAPNVAVTCTVHMGMRCNLTNQIDHDMYAQNERQSGGKARVSAHRQCVVETIHKR